MLEAKTRAQTEVAVTANPSSGAQSAMTAAGKRSKSPLARGVLLWRDGSWKMAVDVIGRVEREPAKKRRRVAPAPATQYPAVPRAEKGAAKKAKEAMQQQSRRSRQDVRISHDTMR